MVQSLCEYLLVSGGPGLGELVGRELTMCAVRPVRVVVGPPALYEDLGLKEAIEVPAVQELVA